MFLCGMTPFFIRSTGSGINEACARALGQALVFNTTLSELNLDSLQRVFCTQMKSIDGLFPLVQKATDSEKQEQQHWGKD